MPDMDDDNDEEDTLNYDPPEEMAELEYDPSDDKWKIANDD